MKRTKKAAQAAATEWKARGFKSSKTESSEEAPVIRQRVPRPEGETIKKTWTKPANSFKIKDGPSSPEKQQKVPKSVKKESGPEGAGTTPRKQRKVSKPKKEEPGAEGAETTAPGEVGGEAAGAAKEKPKEQTKRRKQKFKAGSYNLFIGNLSYEITREDILNHFSVISIVNHCYLFL